MLDLRIRIPVNEDIHNFHMLAVPMFVEHFGEEMFKLLFDSLSALDPDWKMKIVGITTNGAILHDGSVKGYCFSNPSSCGERSHSSMVRHSPTGSCSKESVGLSSRSVLDHVDNYDCVFAMPIETDLRNEEQESIIHHGSMVFSLSCGILVRQASGKGQGVPS
jgi:hypothetical protein